MSLWNINFSYLLLLQTRYDFLDLLLAILCLENQNYKYSLKYMFCDTLEASNLAYWSE